MPRTRPSVEEALWSFGYSTGYYERLYVIAQQSVFSTDLDNISNQAYQGQAALFGESQTCCRGYPWAIEEYISSVAKKRTFLDMPECKGTVDYTVDNGWTEYEAYLGREASLASTAHRPPLCFSVDLKRIRNKVLGGTWPAVDFMRNPVGQHCTLLLAPGYHPRWQELWTIYDLASKALKRYDPEAFVEGRGCVWSARYRAGNDWCPPLGLASGGFFTDVVRPYLTPIEGPVVADEGAAGVPGVEDCDSDDGESDGGIIVLGPGGTDPNIAPREGDTPDSLRSSRNELNGPTDDAESSDSEGEEAWFKASSGKSLMDTYKDGETYQTVYGLGYRGRAAWKLCVMVRCKMVSLSGIRPAGGMVTASAVGEPEPQRVLLSFPPGVGVGFLSDLARRGESDRLQLAMTRPRPDWRRLAKAQAAMRNMHDYLKEHPIGPLQDLVDTAFRITGDENRFKVVLATLNDVAVIDVEAGLYATRAEPDPAKLVVARSDVL